jgi:hypothetical protein
MECGAGGCQGPPRAGSILSGDAGRFRANGVRVLEELPPPANGRRVGFLEAPNGVQIEVIEKVP